MRFDVWCIPSNPEAHVKSCLISVAFILRPEDVAEWNSPIFIYVPVPVINFRIGSGNQNHFRRTVEERRVGPLQFVSKPNSKGDGSRIGHLLARRDIIAATSYVPRVTPRGFVSFTVKADPGLPRECELNREFAAARDGAVDAVFNLRHPAALLIPSHLAPFLSSKHDGVFGDCWLIVAGVSAWRRRLRLPGWRRLRFRNFDFWKLRRNALRYEEYNNQNCNRE